ncbi:nucleotide exchange factor GrpE [Myxococcaceae bacterium GXIMD 01537]
MSSPSEKGSFKAEIGQDVIDEALRSVERREDPGVTLELESPEAPEAPSAELAAARQELEALRAQLEFSQSKGREMMERIKESHERALRSQADLENFRKRAQKEKDEVQKFGSERLLRDLFPVMDNLDRALEAADKAPDLASFLKGVAMTRKSFEDALARHGVKTFSAKGEAFDPRLHEAIQQVETADVPAGHVVQEVVRGFMLNERLVRPALVVVARAPAAPAPSAPEAHVAEPAAAESAGVEPAAPEAVPAAGESKDISGGNP